MRTHLPVVGSLGLLVVVVGAAAAPALASSPWVLAVVTVFAALLAVPAMLLVGARPPSVAAPTRESFHLGVAKRRYMEGELDDREYEEAVEHVLRGGHLTAGGRPGGENDG